MVQKVKGKGSKKKNSRQRFLIPLAPALHPQQIATVMEAMSDMDAPGLRWAVSLAELYPGEVSL